VYGIPGEAAIDEDTKAKALGRLRRIEGQVKGIQRMVGREQEGMDILLQLSAVQGAVAQVQKLILSQHVASCVTEAMRFGSGRERQRRMDELLEVFSRFSGR
jgi:CsoR family transcriptional regulator, copper-sensing transcriptional repressor